MFHEVKTAILYSAFSYNSLSRSPSEIFLYQACNKTNIYFSALKRVFKMCLCCTSKRGIHRGILSHGTDLSHHKLSVFI